MQYSLYDVLYEKYKITKPIRLIELFSGYGSQALALKYLNVNFEHWKTCEWAIKSIQAYKDIHFTNDNKDYSKELSNEEIIDYLYNKGISNNYNEPMKLEQVKRLNEKQLRTIYNNIKSTNNMVNIQQVKGKDLELYDTNKYEYIMTYSFPCLTNDSLILTENGYIEMKNVGVGDKVLTKSNTWQKVAKKFDNGEHQTYFVDAMGFENIHCTENHKFYIREKFKIWNNEKRTYERNSKILCLKK